MGEVDEALGVEGSRPERLTVGCRLPGLGRDEVIGDRVGDLGHAA
jgi:hypothetical protein